MPVVDIVRAQSDDRALVETGRDLFDAPLDDSALRAFLADERHHLLLACVDGKAVGFVSGVETIHPDKGTEMLLYELSVAPEHRQQGIATSLVDALRRLAVECGCYGMWVLTDRDNDAAIATYRAARPSAESDHLMFTWEALARDA